MYRNRSLVAILLLLPLLLSFSYLVVHSENSYVFYRSATIIVPAVEETPQGFRGVSSELTVTVAWPGHGEVYISTSPIAGMDTQSSGRLAVLVASLYAGIDYRSYDFFIKYNTSSLMISGPSASAATAVATFAALKGIEIPRTFSMTGMIGPDGSVNPVGGVVEKLEAVAARGVKLFVIPLGEKIVVDENTGKRVNVVELGRKLGVKVVEAATIIDVLRALGVKYNITISGKSFVYPRWVASKLTSFIRQLRSVAEDNVTLAEKLLGNISFNDIRSVVEKYLNTSKQYLEESKSLEKKGMLYSAASRAFVAAWYATFASRLAVAGSSKKPLEKISEYVNKFIEEAQKITRNANRTYEDFIKRKSIGIVSLQLAITLYDRISLAEEAIKQVNTARDPVDALASSTYAYYRGLTAIQWAEMLRASAGIKQYMLSIKKLAATVSDYIHYAEATLTYLRSLGVPVSMAGVEKASRLLGVDPVAAASITVSTLSDGLVSLYAAFHTGPDRLEVSANTTNLLGSILSGKNITLLLPSFYQEYAESLALGGGEEAAQALSLYSSASSYMLLLYMLIPSKTGAAPSGTTTLVKTKTRTVVTTSITTVVVNNTITVNKMITTTIEKTVEKTVTVPQTVVQTKAGNENWIYPVATLILVLVVFAAICAKK